MSPDITELRERLARKHDLPIGPRFEAVWRLAWEYGHACGLREVEIYFADLVPLVKLNESPR